MHGAENKAKRVARRLKVESVAIQTETVENFLDHLHETTGFAVAGWVVELFFENQYGKEVAAEGRKVWEQRKERGM